MGSLSPWAAFEAAFAELPQAGAYGFSYWMVLVALNNAYFLRVAVNWEIHWLRLLITHVILTIGGGCLTHMFVGRAIPLIADPTAIPSILLAYALMFHCPGDVFVELYKRPEIRRLWVAVSSLQTVIATANNVELVRSVSPNISIAALVVFGTFAAVGGAFLVEFCNALLLPTSTYTHPISGPSAGAVKAVWINILYVVFLTGPGLSVIPHAAKFFPALLALPSFPLKEDTARAVAGVFAFFLGQLVSGHDLMAHSARLLSYIPGFKSTLVPGAMGAAAPEGTAAVAGAPWPLDNGLFGYEYDPLANEESLLDGVMEAALPYTFAEDEDEDEGVMDAEDEEEEEEEVAAPAVASPVKRTGRGKAAIVKKAPSPAKPAGRKH